MNEYSLKRQVELKNFQKIQSIGILFDASNYNNIVEVTKFRERFIQQNKKIEIFGYVDTKDEKTEDFLISNKNLNWFDFPDKKSLQVFLNKDFDVLYGLFLDEDSPLSTVVALSKAKLKIGPLFSNTNYFDISLNTSRNKSFMTLLESINDFLNKINKSNKI
ncbi:MAG: hypothetical protein MUE53_00625 [Chitinophagales bacterium]|nr:hypothetical protein [Chitinophagales bacterium]